MGRTYTVPRSAKGEGRILYIFSVKSLATTAIGAVIGIPFYFLFSLVGTKLMGIIAVVVCAVLGYAVEVLSIPDSPLFGSLRKAGGEKLRDILVRTITFTRRKKIYTYRPKKSVNGNRNMIVQNSEQSDNSEQENSDENIEEQVDTKDNNEVI